MADCVQIALSDGLVMLVDAEDSRLAEYDWQVRQTNRTAYAFTFQDAKRCYAHRMIVGIPDSDPRVVDHIDGDGLNNRRANLRVVTHAENVQAGPGRVAGRRSAFKGVSFITTGSNAGKWRATIAVDRRQRHLGYFQDEQDAARAYDRAARDTFGMVAFQNFPTV